jgi:excisionase family DNA binding protein
MSSDREYLRLDEVAERLGRPISTIRDLARRGKLPGAVKLGGGWLVHWESLNADLLARMQRPKQWRIVGRGDTQLPATVTEPGPGAEWALAELQRKLGVRLEPSR